MEDNTTFLQQISRFPAEELRYSPTRSLWFRSFTLILFSIQMHILNLFNVNPMAIKIEQVNCGGGIGMQKCSHQEIDALQFLKASRKLGLMY